MCQGKEQEKNKKSIEKVGKKCRKSKVKNSEKVPKKYGKK